eukprot:12024275-Alexandrium_andersonii.AAC.1
MCIRDSHFTRKQSPKKRCTDKVGQLKIRDMKKNGYGEEKIKTIIAWNKKRHAFKVDRMFPGDEEEACRAIDSGASYENINELEGSQELHAQQE